MWFMEDALAKENERLSNEQDNLYRENNLLIKEKGALLFENDGLKLRERFLQKEKDDLRKKYISKRDSKIFLEFEHEDLKKDHCELQKELKGTSRKLQAALHNIDMHRIEKTDFQGQLIHQKIMHSQKESKLEHKVRIAERKVEAAESTTRQKQQALNCKGEELKKALKENKEMSEVLVRHGINLFEGQTSGN